MTPPTLRRSLFALVVLATPVPALAGDIADTAHVYSAQKQGAILWDVRDAAAYSAGHIAGAVNVGDIGKVLRDPNREDWLPDATIARILGDAGIDLANKEVIVYSTKGDPYAYFGLSTLRYFGAKSAKVYHGGLDDWKKSKFPVSTEPTKLAPVKLQLTPAPGVVVWTDEMLAKAADARAGKVQIVDARTAREFSGEDVRAIRGGHIPGAVNVPYEQNWVDPFTPGKLAEKEVSNRDGMSLKPAAELSRLYGALDPSKETIVYCQSGVRAAETAAVLREIGFQDVKIFDSSWLVYAGTLPAPAESETFVNIGALNSQIRGMQSRIDQLEAEVSALKKSK